MALELNELQYVIFPGENPGNEWRQAYIDTYRVWKNVWSATFQELDGNGHLFADDMCRQTLVGSILKGDRCVAIGMFHFVDFSLPTASQDSWFKSWPPSALDKLTEQGKKIIVFSNVTVDPDYRGDIGRGIRLRDVIVGLGSKMLMSTDADAWAGIARCNKGVDQASYTAGATHIENGKLHGVDVAIVATYRRALQAGHTFDFAVEALWKNRQIFGDARSRLKQAA